MTEKRSGAPISGEIITEGEPGAEGSGHRRGVTCPGGMAARLPVLSINVLDMEDRTTHYFIGTNGRSLAAGERFAFSTRLAAPQDGVKSVSVTFKEYSE